MLVILPIRTESAVRRQPSMNIAIMSVNALCFIMLSEGLGGDAIAAFKQNYLFFQSRGPALHQFFTYQFLHADMWHLLGNMLFLWVFGNSVNSKMGNGPYLLFYLGGGVFAAWGYALFNPDFSYLLGASGAVAAITTAYLALFPRSRVTVLVWLFIFIQFFQLPAMIIIGLKIIVWDNIIAPSLSQADQVAHGAHLAGYFFGFIGALGMLLFRAVPRDQFDILAVWKRWKKRRDWASAMSGPAGAAQGKYGTVARKISYDPKQSAEHDAKLDAISEKRGRIAAAISQSNVTEACSLYDELVADNPGQCMSEREQLDIAREYYATDRFAQAVAAFGRFVECYPDSIEASNVQMLVGIIYARDLKDYENAETHLEKSIGALRDEGRRSQCSEWLTTVRKALGKTDPATPEG
jgi:membrane associated rhomboid family serine protease